MRRADRAAVLSSWRRWAHGAHRCRSLASRFLPPWPGARSQDRYLHHQCHPTDRPGIPGEPGTPSDPGGGGSAPAVKPVCRFTLASPAKEVPCSSEQGWWVQSRQCYAKAASPQPAKSDPVWEGRTDGAVYDCYRPALGPGGFIVTQFWSASPPGVGAPPDPRVIAQQAIAVMNLRAVRIGMVPEPRPGRVGLVGLPVWMWAQQPDSTTWGPVTRTATAAWVHGHGDREGHQGGVGDG